MPPKRIQREVYSIDGQFGTYTSSQSTSRRLSLLKGAHGIPGRINLISPEATDSPETPSPGHACAFEIFFSECGLYFPLPDILIDFMHEFGIALPQLCPNVIRTILSLLTLAEEDNFLLSLPDLLQLYAIKKGRTQGTFFLSPRKGFRVFEDFPEKDEQWRKSFFFFRVNELTFGEKTGLFVSEWSARAASVDLLPISKTFASHFSSFVRQDLGWESLSSDRVRASGKRLRSRTDLAISSPPFEPRIFSEEEMSAPSYRAEKKMERERAKQEKDRLKSDKVVMTGTLEDSKLQAANKAKQPRAEEDGGARQKPSTLASKNDAPAPDSRTPSKATSSRDPSKRYGDKKRKQSDKDARSPARSVRVRTEERDASPSQQKEKGKKGDSQDLVKSIPLNAPFLRDTDNLLSSGHVSAPPLPFADLVRSFTHAGAPIPPLKELKPTNQENYLRFAEKLGELSDKDREIESFKQNEEENSRMVDRANSVLSRMREAEARVLALDIANTDLAAKLESGKNAYLAAIDNENRARAELLACEEKLRKLEEGQAALLADARREERRKVRAQFKDFTSKYQSFYAESEEV
ncbi:hypothetical protein [Arabidopsis thaliana]|uniref:Uncharacterized protein AT4g03830 n=1 Tax=Arabidopsis thaliana TaxID=3702 RepID=Q9M107_ARATH|nr:hypothetical protein (Protein of unknown function, DUF601) [Arabidopsis thaliana]AEE82355.1 hypothetical protein (Protein of unknown function, DUF601) [Arabidopsis thaliana]CAB80806.1 hypothetical protein [Arabidopsis thaliana]|eukprot:NP_192292.1 hypothetical protein (Protein of unknown function, DUF601) [Arabidopsis thaliana]